MAWSYSHFFKLCIAVTSLQTSFNPPLIKPEEGGGRELTVTTVNGAAPEQRGHRESLVCIRIESCYRSSYCENVSLVPGYCVSILSAGVEVGGQAVRAYFVFVLTKRDDLAWPWPLLLPSNARLRDCVLFGLSSDLSSYACLSLGNRRLLRSAHREW